MTKATKAIFSTVMLVAVLIAGWAFLKDERTKSMSPIPSATIQNPETAAPANVDAEIGDIDTQLQLLDEDYANIDETLTQPAVQNETAGAGTSK